MKNIQKRKTLNFKLRKPCTFLNKRNLTLIYNLTQKNAKKSPPKSNIGYFKWKSDLHKN